MKPRSIAPALVLALVLAACGGGGATTTTAASSETTTTAASVVGDGRDRATGFDDVVVDADWLAERLDDPKVRVIEVSTDPGVYERGHIPGAVNFYWHTDLVDTLSRDIVAKDRFEELVRAAGIDDDTTVVVYGDANNWFAAWGAWVFDLYGFVDVRLLDGGRRVWEDQGRELAVAAPSHPAGTFTASDADPTLRALLPEVLAVATGDSAAALIDIRSPAEYSGEVVAPEGFAELAVRAGHIPTAVNVPWASAVAEDGTFKSVDELREIYAAVGADGSGPVIVYCRIGERASHTWFVLSKILGYDVALYDGSWTEWGNTVGLPVENPSGTVWGTT